MFTYGRSTAMLGLFAWICALAQGSTTLGQTPFAHKDARSWKPRARPATPVLDRIRISVDPPATGSPLKLQHEIALQFSRQSFDPPERRKEYAWVDPRPADGKIGLWLTGWWGVIETVTKSSDGWLVRISVWPDFANGGHAVRRMEDGRYAEVYQFVDGRLHFQEAILPKNPGRPLGVTW